MIFGLPIVLNPIFFFPFILIPATITYIAYFVTMSGLAAPLGYTVPWTTPTILNPFLASGLDFGALFLGMFTFVLAIFMWMPFVKLADRQLEKANEAK